METGKKRSSNLARRIIGDVLILAVILLAVDVVIIMIHKINTVVLKQAYQTMFWKELVILAILLLFAIDVRFGIFTKIRKKAARVIGWILRIVLILLTIYILFFFGKVVSGGLIHTAGSEKNVIVLGLALENGQPRQDLILRVETGQKHLEKNPDATLILTGGNADESGRTEADVMRDLLIDRGVPDDHIYLEDKAKTTIENFKNTAKMIDPAAPIVLVTSDYHMDRAVKTAKKAGFTNIRRLPAPSEFWAYGSNMMWEVTSNIDNILHGR